MASHRHNHCHHQHSTCYSDHCTCNCSSPQPQLHYPSHPSTDPLLIQAIASQLLQQQSQQQIYTQHLRKPQNHQKQHRHSQQEQTQALLVNSLIRRIEALESSLKHVSSSPSPSWSLRDFAARTIQIHFRGYLVRRSRTLRNLKYLAIIKSNFNSLRSSISDKPYFNHEALSQKAMDLLHKLDSIQGGDPMIRDGKRSISRELVHILEYIDEISIKRKQIYTNSMKKVRFVEDNYDSRVCKGAYEQPSHDEDVGDLEEQGASISSDDQRELMESLCEKIGNIEGFTRVYEDDEEESTSSRLNHGNRSPKDLKRNQFHGENGNPSYSAPLPVQMEPIREDLRRSNHP